MEMICLQCGDVGFTNAFVHCVRCLDVVVHRYCLDVIPKTYDEFVHWVCDDCHVKERKCPIGENGDSTALNIEELSCDGQPNQSNKSSATLEWAKSFNKRSFPGELRVADELVDEGILKDKGRAATVSTKEKGKHRLGNNFLKRHNERPAVNNNDSTVLSKTRDWRRFCLESRKSDLKTHTDKHRVLSKNEDAHRNSQKKKPVPSQKKKKPIPSQKKKKPIPSQKKKKSIPSQTKKSVLSSETVRQENEQLSLENCCSNMTSFETSIDPSNDHIEISRPEISEVKTSAPNLTNDFCKRSSEDCSELAEPVLEPIWWGNFNIWNTNEGIEGLMAHMSNRACQKVYEEACRLPVVLEQEIRPKSDVWPRSFEKSDPSGEHIALYFFPSEISERDYDILVDEMVSEELAMRAILPDAELLVFTSRELPLPYWRFKDKYYLWGVFRGKQQQQDSTKGNQKHASEPGCNSSRVPTKTKWHGHGRSLSSLSNSSSSNGSGSCSSNVLSF